MKPLIITAALFVISTSAFARPVFFPGRRWGGRPVEVRPDPVTMTGNGCPANGAVATLAPDGSSISVLFDKMSTNLPPGPLVRQRVQCIVNLAVQFGGGMRVSVVGADVRGFVNVPQGSQTTLSLQHFAPGRMMMRPFLRRLDLSQTFSGPRSEPVTLHSEPGNGDWASCGPRGAPMRSVPLIMIALTIDSTNNNPTENLISSLDSLDVSGRTALTYKLAWETDQPAAPTSASAAQPPTN